MTHELPQTTNDDSNTSRREFLGAAAAAACAMCLAGTMAYGATATTTPASGAAVDAGPVTAFAKDGVYDAMARTQKFFVVRDGKSLHASSALCTHRNALLQKTAKPDAPFHCPKHNSDFDKSGIVLDGPAKTSLPRFAIKIENGHVFVDTGKSFEERDWNDPAASSTVG